MRGWPDKDGALLSQYIDHLSMRSPAPLRSTLGNFQRFVSRRSARSRLGWRTIAAWFRERSAESPVRAVRQYGYLVNRFLDCLWRKERWRATP